ncbi:hypothetical protein IV102_34225 [bacterium]|nr:hypothetical protein [bacterium]
MRKILALALILVGCAAQPTPSPSPTSTVSGYEYVLPGSPHLRVRFPSTPKESSEFKSGVKVDFAACLHEGQTFTAYARGLGPMDQGKTLEQLCVAPMREVGEPTEIRTTYAGGYSAVEASVRGARMRVFFKDNRLYVLSVPLPVTPSAQAFLDSFGQQGT